MLKYGQFCPIAKASEVLGEKWTVLIVRELLQGTKRFNEPYRIFRRTPCVSQAAIGS